MRIPTANRQVTEQGPSRAPQLRTPEAPKAAFGGDVAAAQGTLGDTIEKSATIFAEHMIRRENVRKQKEIVDRDTEVRFALQDTLYSEEKDETGRPRGFLLRQLDQADGSTVEFDSAFEKLRGEYLEKLEDPDQKESLSQLLDQQYLTARGSVISHEASQTRQAFNASFDANLKQRVSDAGRLTNPEQLQNHINASKQIIYSALSAQGRSEDEMVQRGREFAGAAAKASILGVVRTNPRLARLNLEAIKADIQPDDYNALKQDIDNAENQVLALQKAAKKEADRQLEVDLYMRSISHEVSISEIDEHLNKGRITPSFHGQLRRRILNLNNDPEIPVEQKSAKVAELLEDFKALGGRVYKNRPDLKKPLEEAEKEAIASFRAKVQESAPYLTAEQESKFLRYTESAWTESQKAKVGLWAGVSQTLDWLASSSTAKAAALISIFEAKTPEEAAVAAEKIKTEAVIANNPNRSSYTEGQKITVDGKPWVVVGFDVDGEPLIEELK